MLDGTTIIHDDREILGLNTCLHLCAISMELITRVHEGITVV